MKSKSKLIGKGSLPRNFRLTFNNEKGELRVILHQSKEEMFKDLKIGCEYSFSFFKGKKNHFFVNPQSIKLLTPRVKVNNDVKDFYYSKLLQELDIKELTSQSIDKKLESIKNARHVSQNWGKQEHFLLLTKETLYSIYLKNEILGNSTEQEQKLLLDIETLLFFNKYA